MTDATATGPEDIEPLLALFNFHRKREVVQHLRTITVHGTAFANLILGGRLGLIQPYQYACHFGQYVPEHLEPTDKDLAALGESKIGPLAPAAKKTMTKIYQIFVDRRIFAAHLFFSPGKRYWHLFYFDQRDRSDHPNHWKHGPHIHFANDLFVSMPLDVVWGRVVAGDTGFLRAPHVRYNDHHTGRRYPAGRTPGRT